MVTDITCKNHITPHYYSANQNFQSVCYVCGHPEDLMHISQETIDRFQTVHPICENCKEAGFELRTRGESKMGSKKQKSK